MKSRRRHIRKNKKIMRSFCITIIVIVLAILCVTGILIAVSKSKSKQTNTDTISDNISENTVYETESSSELQTEETNPTETKIIQTEPTETETDTKEETSMAVPDFSEFLNKGASASIPEDTDFSEYSTERVPFGIAQQFDENNRPTGLDWYRKNYGQYAADFIQPFSKYVFLTFDEGYEYGMTSDILDTLKEKDVKAVFFVTLPYVKDNPELVRRMIDEGHVVGNHTSTHPAGGLQQYSVEKQIEDIDNLTQYVKQNYNYDMYLFRFPEGAFSEQSLAIVQSLGYRSVFWSFAYKDWVVTAQPDIEESLENALKKVHGGAIYLLHAESETNTRMLGRFIDGVREKGLEFGYYSKTN